MNEKEYKKKISELEEKIKELEKVNCINGEIINKLPLGVQVFDSKGFSFSLNQMQQQLLGLPDMSTGIGKFNVLTDPFSKKTGVDI